MKFYFILAILTISVILVLNYDNPIFAVHLDDPHRDEKIEQQNILRYSHFPYNGICAPGFVPLDEICVLNDICGSGAYVGKVCVMDGKIQPYLKPLHQKHAGISVDNIICAEGKEVMFKQHNASPACVNSDSIEKLKHRGWQTEKPVMACTLEWNPMCGMDGNTYGNPCNLRTEHMALKHQGECKVN